VKIRSEKSAEVVVVVAEEAETESERPKEWKE
jgi:hypothetical protein